MVEVEIVDEESMRIIAIADPTEDEIGRIMSLKHLCEQKQGIDILLSRDFLLSMDKPGVGAFECMNGSRIVGFAYFYSFFKEEVEAMIFANPDEDLHGIFTLLLDRMISESERRGHVRLLLMNDRRFDMGARLLVDAGFSFAFSEHRMENRGNPIFSDQHVDLIRVNNDDPRLRQAELASFGNFHSKLDQSRYLALAEGGPVGKVDVNLEEGIAELTGFCVPPDLRKRGYGTAILSGIVDVLRKRGEARILLDVQTDNDVALGLYLKSGFRNIFTIDYYQMVLGEKKPPEPK